MTTTWPHRLIYGLFAAVAIMLPACSSDGHLNLFGYTSAPNYDCSIRSIYVPICKNKTMIRGIEFDATRAIIREIQTKTPYKVVDSPRLADTELVCTITARTKTIVNQNQLGETREGQISISVEVIWRDLRPGHEGNLLSGKGLPPVPNPNQPVNPLRTVTPVDDKKSLPVVVTPTTTYQPELGGSTTSSQLELANRLAVQIVSMMEVWGK